MEKELQKALKVIAEIAMHADPHDKNEAWQDVYMIAHSYSVDCKHLQWRKRVEVVEKKLAKQ